MQYKSFCVSNVNHRFPFSYAVMQPFQRSDKPKESPSFCAANDLTSGSRCFSSIPDAATGEVLLRNKRRGPRKIQQTSWWNEYVRPVNPSIATRLDLVPLADHRPCQYFAMDIHSVYVKRYDLQQKPSRRRGRKMTRTIFNCVVARATFNLLRCTADAFTWLRFLSALRSKCR